MKPARQVAFITGGLSGIGFAAAIKMLERGVAVCVASTRAKLRVLRMLKIVSKRSHPKHKQIV